MAHAGSFCIVRPVSAKRAAIRREAAGLSAPRGNHPLARVEYLLVNGHIMEQKYCKDYRFPFASPDAHRQSSYLIMSKGQPRAGPNAYLLDRYFLWHSTIRNTVSASEPNGCPVCGDNS